MAAPKEYTPRTKLQKDKDFFSGLGAGSSIIAKAFQFPIGEVPVFSKGTGVGSVLPKKTKDFSSFFKTKTKGLTANDRKGIRAEDEKRQKRNWKDSKYMERRNMDVDGLPKASAHQNLNLQSRAIGTALGNAPKVGPLTRKERLDKWKREKETDVKKVAQRTVAPATKSSASASTASRSKPNLNAASSTYSSRTNLNKGPGAMSSSTSRLNPAPKPTVNKPPVSKTVGLGVSNPNPPPDRRVTRAMASGRTQVVPKPPVQSMSQLSLQVRKGIPVKEAQGGEIKENPKAAMRRNPPSTGILDNNKSSSQSKKEEAGPRAVIRNQIVSPAQTVIAEDEQNGNGNLMETNAPPAPAAPPKKKVGPLDRCFMEFNGKLSEAVTFLHTDTLYWTNKLEVSSNIPENEKDEVSSHIGKLGLLLKSKLPQFAELLFHYLSNDGVDGPVLECDLAGWWDVATIQIEKIKEASNKLKLFEANGWIPLPEETKNILKRPTVRVHKAISEGALEAKNKENKAKPKAASSGIRAFINQKRKAAMRQSNPLPGECETDVTLIDLVLPLTPRVNSNARPTEEQRKKEANAPVDSLNLTEANAVESGDVSIKASPPRESQQQPEVFESPLRVLSSNSRSFRTPQPARVVAMKIPNRRASLIMLKVRNSMGALGKVGMPFALQDTESQSGIPTTPSKRLASEHMDSLLNNVCDDSIAEEPASDDVPMQ